MYDVVPSPYGPREFDCTGTPKHWPCGTGLEAVVGAPCPAAGCDGVAAPTKSNSDPALAPFCLRCRHRGAVALDRGSVDEAGLVEWLRAGLHKSSARTKKAQTAFAEDSRGISQEAGQKRHDIFDSGSISVEVSQSCIARLPGSPVLYESSATAAARLRAHEPRLREAARSRGMFASARRVPRRRSGGGGLLLPSTQWDLAWAGYLANRRVSGPKRSAA